jgi:hypothetical protein
MKVQVELQIEIAAKATYRDEKVSVSVSGTMPLTEGSGRSATATVEGASDKVTALFQKAFEALMAEQQDQVITRARVASSEALATAARMGEL